MPLTRARFHPWPERSSSTSRWKPFWPRTTGARIMSLEPAGRVITASTICVLLVALMGAPLRAAGVPSLRVLVTAHE